MMVISGGSERVEEGCLTQLGRVGNVSKKRLHRRLYKVMAKSSDLEADLGSNPRLSGS